MSEHLTALDATFLELEEADDSAHMHTGVIMVFDPRPDGGSPSREEVRRYLASRLGQLPRYGQRLSESHTGGMSWPEWQDDPAFDIDKHVARAALPAPGGEEELAEWASGFFSQRLDRHRPLWEMALVEGLANGRWAIATKTHHCMVDGVGSADVGHLLRCTPAKALGALPRWSPRQRSWSVSLPRCRTPTPGTPDVDSDARLRGAKRQSRGRRAPVLRLVRCGSVSVIGRCARMHAKGAA